MGKWNEKKGNIIFGLMMLVFITSLPLLTDFLISGTWLSYQLLRIEALQEGIKEAGILLWAKPDWIAAEGYSFAFFHGDTFLYIPAVFRLLGCGVQTGYKLFLTGINVGTVGISYYSFKRLSGDAYTGLLGSALYSVSVYRMFLLYSMAELGEAEALTFLPLVLLGSGLLLEREDKKQNEGWLWLAFGLSGILRSHILSFGITVCFLVLFTAACWKSWRKAVFWKEAAFSAGLFLLLNLNYFYAMAQYIGTGEFVLNPVSGEPIQAKGLQMAQLFMCFYQAGNSYEFGTGGVSNAAPVGLGISFLMVPAVFCYLLLTEGRELERAEKRKGILCLGFGLAACYMSLTVFPWDFLFRQSGVMASLVSAIRAPWHFLQAALLLFTMLGCVVYGMIKRRYPVWGRACGIGFVGLSCFVSSYLLAQMLFTCDFVRITEAERVWMPAVEEGKEAAPLLANGLKTCKPDMIWYVLTAVSALTLAGSIIFLLRRLTKKRKEREAEGRA